MLGLTIDHADLLLAALSQAALVEEAVLGKADQYGQRYVIDFVYRGPAGAASIRSAWILLMNETAPRLVTCFML